MVKILSLALCLSLSAFAQEISIPPQPEVTLPNLPEVPLPLVVEDNGDQSVPTTPDETCDEKLQKKLHELLEKDHNGILGLHYHLTMLKLAKKVNSSNEKSLEDYIQAQSRRLAQLNTQDPATLTRLHSLYNGQANLHVQAVYNNIASMRQGLGNLDYIAGRKIDNDDVASYIMFETMQNQSSTEFSKTDVAISWMMKNIRTRAGRTRNAAALDFSNQVARYTGLIKGINKASNSEINTEMNGIKRRIDAFMAEAKRDVMAANPECSNNGTWAGECTLEQTNSEVAGLMLEMNGVTATVAGRVAAAAASRTRGKATVAVGSEGNRTRSCGGQFFEPKELSFDRVEFGRPDPAHAAHGIDHGKLHGEIMFGPIRCKKHVKKFLVQLDNARREICCQNRPTQYEENKATVGMEADFGCRAFYGIPYVAEVGIKGGVALEGGLTGKITVNEQNCKSKGCIYGKGLVRPYLSVYAEIVAGLASGEFGVSWEPQLNVGYCKEEGAKGKFKGELVPNDVYLGWMVKAGWGLVERSGGKVIYSTRSPIKLF